MQPALPPGPRVPAAIQSVAWWARPVPFLERCRASFGNRFTLRLVATPPFVMLADPDELKQVFTAPPDILHPGEGGRILEPVVGANSVLLLDGAAHMEQRKLMLGAFHRERMEGLADLVASVTEQEVAAWPREQPLELHPRLQALTLEVMLRAVLGLEAGERLELLRDRLTRILEFGSRPTVMIPALQVSVAGRGPWAAFERLRADADRLLFELIDERRPKGGEGDDVLAMLLAARHEDGSEMSKQELRDELMTLLVAGHETTASELAWAFERLVREPRVLGVLCDEVDRDDGEEYLTATVQETLRRRPVLLNAQPRFVKEPFEVGGWTFPSGACLVPNVHLVHHDASIYPDPYAFRPERFLEQPPGTYTWIPFGGGRRRCLGASFATLEMKIVLREVLFRARIAPASGALERTRRRSITVSPRLGARTILKDRTGAREPVGVG
ncbi:MAG: cytochrome P450 [Solirubrobacterales bacterium]|nr:cytochrome P450 [Solirubrobacterales bacterium]